jgi:CheY-like chemotaxis protein
MKIRAIVLEDNESVRETLSIILKLRGYEVIAFPDPGACIAYLDHESTALKEHCCCDILITDIRMPGMTGLEYLNYQKEQRCRVPNVAVMSGSWTEADLQEARRLGCRIFEKPFVLEELNEWLSHCEKAIDPARELPVLSGGPGPVKTGLSMREVSVQGKRTIVAGRYCQLPPM